MLLTLTGCGTDKVLKQAATEQGTAQARVTLPALPDDCRKKEPHAAAAVGDEVRAVLKAEMRQLDKQNSRTDRCARFYDETGKALR